MFPGSDAKRNDLRSMSVGLIAQNIESALFNHRLHRLHRFFGVRFLEDHAVGRGASVQRAPRGETREVVKRQTLLRPALRDRLPRKIPLYKRSVKSVQSVVE